MSEASNPPSDSSASERPVERPAAASEADTQINFNLALDMRHAQCHAAADAFWKYWNENGETHKHGYYESTWGAINRAIRLAGIRTHEWKKP